MFEEVLRAKKVQGMLGARVDEFTVVVHPSERGNLKQALLKLGWPAEDYAGYVDGEAHEIALAEEGWHLRPYQQEAVDSFWHGGSGVVVLPCGAGKTIVGAAAMATAKATTLILVTNTVSARQWREELLKRTSLTDEEIGEYSGSKKEVRAVTIATYQVMTTRRKGVYAHLELLDARDWGLIVYDEVHLLPAPIFRMTADLQARRRRMIRSAQHLADHFEEVPLFLFALTRNDPTGGSIYPAVWSAMLAAQAGVGSALTANTPRVLHPEDGWRSSVSPEGKGWLLAATVSFGFPTGRSWPTARRSTR